MGSGDGGGVDWENWTSLQRFVKTVGARDVALDTKADILRHLCYFLSCSASTFKYPSPTSASEEIKLLAVVGDRGVHVSYDDLVALHGVLFQELARLVPLGNGSGSGFPSSPEELRVAALILRCCIKLLPLMELFDTGLRNSMGVELVTFLQKICSPWEPCLLRIASDLEPYRAPMLCASLEVFVDELLCRSKTQLLLVQNEKGARTTSQLIMEATLAHVMISAHPPSELHAPRAQRSELSLQSAVMLLDRVITDNAPRYLLSHVVRMVSQALEDSMGKVVYTTSRKWFSHVESGKVDSNDLQVCLWLVSSVLERGISLYLKFAAAPHLAHFVESGPQPSAAPLLASCLWSYVCHRGRMRQECEAALESMVNDAHTEREECMDQTCCGRERIPDNTIYSNIERSSGTHFCGRELRVVPVWEEEEHSSLVADVLHLMHSALNFFTQQKSSFDDVWLGLIGSFHQCMQREVTAADSVGDVLVFFTDMLYYEAERSISDAKMREYLELLEALLEALLMEHTWRKSSQLFGEDDNQSVSPSSYARKVVSLLQGFLEEPDLPEILGGNAVSIILQINCFLNDFCEFMDKVLSTSDWRDYIPTNGRRIARRIPKTIQEVVLLDRNVGEENLDHDMPHWDGHQSPDQEGRRSPVELQREQPRPSNAGGQQGEEIEQGPTAGPSNAEAQQNDPCPVNITLDKQQLRPSTLPILQRLMKYRRRQPKLRDDSPERVPETVVSEPEPAVKRTPRPVRKCRVASEDESPEGGNQFVAEVLLLEKTSENFDDLNDFIVCKQGRSYTTWLNRRTKFRRRKRTREIWKRSEEKQKLISMLNIV